MLAIPKHRLIELYNQVPRLTYQQIADILGIDKLDLSAQIYRLQKSKAIVGRKGTGAPLLPTQHQLNRIKQIIQLKQDGKSYTAIAKQFGISRQAISDLLTRHCPEYIEQHTNELQSTRQQIIDLYNQFPRLTYIEIAERMAISTSRISTTLKAYRCNNVLAYRNRSSLVPTRKQLERIDCILKLRHEGLTWQAIADSLNITMSSLFVFVNRHLPGYFDQTARRKSKNAVLE